MSLCGLTDEKASALDARKVDTLRIFPVISWPQAGGSSPQPTESEQAASHSRRPTGAGGRLLQPAAASEAMEEKDTGLLSGVKYRL
jgi:hypothetical protein